MAGVVADADDRAVAVVGMGVAVPGASNPDELWTTLARPAEFTAPGERFDLEPEPSADSGPPDRNRAGLGGFMRDFRPHPRLSAELADGTLPRRNPAVLWLRHCLLHALEDVTIQPGDRVGVVAGLNVNSSPPLEESLLVDAVAAALAAGSPVSKAGVARAIRRAFPSAQDDPHELFPHRAVRQACAGLLPSDYDVLVIDAACSPGLYAVDLGAKAVRAGECDLALCGACCVLSRLYLVLSAMALALSPSGAISALDDAADGTLFSDGAAVLALKQYRRARADGDPILGFVCGFGGSSDGRGKVVQAPSSAGQMLALRRAWQAAGVGPCDVDWILAHAAGTPVGDRAEIATLTACADANTRWAITAPKSAIGHTGQASGVVAAVHALLGLQRSMIPAQPRYTTPLNDALDGSRLRVPTRDEPWPQSPDRPRMAGISAFGVGGTDAHLLIADRPTRSARTAPADEPLVIVQWAAHLPGKPDRKAVRYWLGGEAPSWPTSFGDRYPRPDPSILRLPPSVLARVDRTQLMAVECADTLWRMLGDTATHLRPETGVFAGHSGPVRGDSAAVLHCGKTHALRRLAGAGIGPAEEQLESACAQSPPATGDTLMGILPNLVAARVASALDLHGPSLAVDAGRDSGLAALEIASRYLLAGDIGIALVGAVCGHDTASLPFADNDTQTAEGAFFVALVRADTARALELKPLAHVAMTRSRTTAPGDDTAVFATADRIVAVIRAIEAHRGQVDIAPVEDTRSRTAQLTVGSPRPLAAASEAARGGIRRLHGSRPDSVNSRAWSLTLTESDHALLSCHTVQGLPTVPGAVLVELAVEAASELVPGLIPAAVTDVRFRRFVRASADDRVSRIRVSATRDAAPSPVEPGTVAVRVAIESAASVPHAEMTVRLARTVAHVAALPESRDGSSEAVSDPYRIPGSPVFLAGVLGALREPRIRVDGASARYRVEEAGPGLDLASYRIPVIALDCLFRMFPLARRHRFRTLAVGVPVAASRIDLGTTCNDEEITRLFGELELRGDATGRTLVAIAPDGRVLLRVTGLEMHELR